VGAFGVVPACQASVNAWQARVRASKGTRTRNRVRQDTKGKFTGESLRACRYAPPSP
jgi:hypothetical protein